MPGVGPLAQTYTRYELAALEAGLLSGRFALQERLHRGAAADVYLATDRTLGRLVAIKLLHPDLIADGSFAARFEREARAAAALSHPNVVAVFDYGIADADDLLWTPSRRTAASRGITRRSGSRTVPFIVMEHVSGPTLKAIIRERAPLPEPEALDVAMQVAAALDAAHGRGLVHRNVKPENVLLAANGVIKVTDFGLARALGEAQVTVTRTMLGTAQYASPEQTLGRRVDGRSDLYSLGALLYELLTGRVPFVGESVIAVAWQHVYDTPVPVRQVRPELSPATEAVVLRSLAKDPAHRFQTAAEMGAALKQASSCPTSSWRANGGGANVSRQIGSSVGDASARWVWPLVLVASALGALAATVANWPSPIRPVLVLWFLLVCPGMALVRLLWLGDAIAEWTLAVAVSLALEIIIAGTMLYAGLWVPPLILATLAAVSLAGALVQLWRSANQRGPVDAAARRVATERESWWSCQDLHRLLVAALARLGGG